MSRSTSRRLGLAGMLGAAALLAAGCHGNANTTPQSDTLASDTGAAGIGAGPASSEAAAGAPPPSDGGVGASAASGGPGG